MKIAPCDDGDDVMAMGKIWKIERAREIKICEEKENRFTIYFDLLYFIHTFDFAYFEADLTHKYTYFMHTILYVQFPRLHRWLWHTLNRKCRIATTTTTTRKRNENGKSVTVTSIQFRVELTWVEWNFSNRMWWNVCNEKRQCAHVFS